MVQGSFRTASFDFFSYEDYQTVIKKKISAGLEGYEKDSEKIVFLEDLLAKEKEKKDPGKRRISGILTNLGNSYYKLGGYPEALKCYEEALELDRELGYKQGEANQLGNIGLIYRALGQPQKALKYHKEALEIFKKIGDKKNEKLTVKSIDNLKKKEKQNPKTKKE